MIEGVRARNWPKTRAKMINMGIAIVSVDKGIRHKVEVEYTYKVDGKSYRSTRLKTIEYIGSEASANDWMARLKRKMDADGYIDAHYNPAKPSASVLESGFSAVLLVFAVFIQIVLLGCIALSFYV